MMSEMDQDALRSFFQTSGIHGKPYKRWNDSGSTNVGVWQGYCTHSTVLFPTWHRPYVALYEVGACTLPRILNGSDSAR